MAPIVQAELRCLLELSLITGETHYLHNFPQAGPMTYQGKTWNYIPLPIPQLDRYLQEDNQSIRLSIANIGSAQHGYLPIRDWAQNGTLDNAYLIMRFISPDTPTYEQVFTIAEREFKDGPNETGVIVLNLRQPDDGDCEIMTSTYSEDLIGPGMQYRPS